MLGCEDPMIRDLVQKNSWKQSMDPKVLQGFCVSCDFGQVMWTS